MERRATVVSQVYFFILRLFCIQRTEVHPPCTLSTLHNYMSSSVEFSSRWYLYAWDSPYILHPISQKLPWCCLWNRSSVGLIDNGPFSSFQGTVECFLFLIPPSDRWCDVFGFVPADSVSAHQHFRPTWASNFKHRNIKNNLFHFWEVRLLQKTQQSRRRKNKMTRDYPHHSPSNSLSPAGPCRVSGHRACCLPPSPPLGPQQHRPGWSWKPQWWSAWTGGHWGRGCMPPGIPPNLHSKAEILLQSYLAIGF